MENERKKVIYSAIKPTGDMTLGNFLGAIKNWADMQAEYDCLYAIADAHAITVRQEPALLRKRTKDIFALLMACGISPESNTLYLQTHVPEHLELAWILNCFTYMGELSRMTQYKDKSRKGGENLNAGLFTYPCLMAADILLYQTDLVPVGDDQRQHVELTRDIALRVNNVYGNIFRVPEAFTPKVGARIMSLSDPSSKMSKSDDGDENACVEMLDAPEVIMRKFKRAVTDSETSVRYDPENKPGVSNLMDIYSTCTGKSHDEIEREFEGKGYGAFKPAVGEAVVETLRPVQAEYKRLIADKAFLENVMREGSERASAMARRTLGKLKKKLGFYII